MRIALGLAGGCYIVAPLALRRYIAGIHCSEAMHWVGRDMSFLLPEGYLTDMVVDRLAVAWIRAESSWASDQSCCCMEQRLQDMMSPGYIERALGSCCFG